MRNMARKWARIGAGPVGDRASSLGCSFGCYLPDTVIIIITGCQQPAKLISLTQKRQFISAGACLSPPASQPAEAAR